MLDWKQKRNAAVYQNWGFQKQWQILHNSQAEVSNGEMDSAKRSDSLMTASAVAATEISLPKF